ASPVHFENPVVLIRLVTYIFIVLSAPIVMFGVQTLFPVSMLLVPIVVGITVLMWRAGYRSEPAVSQLHSVIALRDELCERLRVMQSRIREVESDKKRRNREFSDRRADRRKEKDGLNEAEQKDRTATEARLRAAISPSVNSKQKLGTQEANELNALQNGVGKRIATFSQSIAALVQAESNELSNALKAKQTAFV